LETSWQLFIVSARAIGCEWNSKIYRDERVNIASIDANLPT
jgi:hypothetical protein